MEFSDSNLDLKEVQKLEGHADLVWSLAWNPAPLNCGGASAMLASCSGDKTMRIWQMGPTRQVPPPCLPSSLPSLCQYSLGATLPCLAYIEGPPNNSAPAPSRLCCRNFLQALTDAGPNCLCSLVRNPLIMSFFIDIGCLFALFSACDRNDIASATLYFHNACQKVAA